LNSSIPLGTASQGISIFNVEFSVNVSMLNISRVPHASTPLEAIESGAFGATTM